MHKKLITPKITLIRMTVESFFTALFIYLKNIVNIIIKANKNLIPNRLSGPMSVRRSLENMKDVPLAITNAAINMVAPLTLKLFSLFILYPSKKFYY